MRFKLSALSFLILSILSVQKVQALPQSVGSFPQKDLIAMDAAGTSGQSIICVLKSDSLYCSGKSNWYTPPSHVTGLVNARQLSVSSSHLCYLDDRGIFCYGAAQGVDSQLSQVPKYLKDVQQISVGFQKTCAIDINGAHCWGLSEKSTDLENGTEESEYVYESNLYEAFFSQIKNPKMILADKHGQYAYVIDENGNLFDCLNGMVKTSQVQLFNSNGLYKCAYSIVDGVICSFGGGSKSFGRPSNLPSQLTQPEAFAGGQKHNLASGYSYMCGLQLGNVSCWAHPDSSYSSTHVTKVPESVLNIKLITAVEDYVCAYDSSQVTCWGDSLYMESPVALSKLLNP